MAYPLLTARLSNVVLVSHAVAPALLRAFVPPGPDGAELEVETRPELVRAGEEQGVVSMMALEFAAARMLGVRWPGLTGFLQINLQFYVRQARRRGIVFVRQIISRPILAWCTRTFQNEPIVWAPITTEVKQAHRTIGVEYRLRCPEEGLAPSGRVDRRAPLRQHVIRVFGVKPVTRPSPDSLEHWLKERQWSFGLDRRGRPSVMEIIHPNWSTYPVAEHDLRLDYGSLFGPEWGFLNKSAPISVMLALGSEVAVFPKRATIGVRWGERHSG